MDAKKKPNKLPEMYPGKLIRAKFDVNPDPTLFDDYYLPMMVIKEYEWFYHCVVMPHRNLKLSQGVSKPYAMDINKKDIDTGVVTVKEYWPPIGKEAP